MNLYERVSKKKVAISSEFDIKLGQVIDIKEHGNGPLDMIWVAFKFGYIQGLRAAEKEK